MSSTTEQFGELKNNKGGTGEINIRSNPSLTASAVQKPVGTRVKILEKKQPGDGFTWYKVSYDNTKSGWVRDDVIKVLPPQTSQKPDADDTRLYFETDKRQVRVYQTGTTLYMNVYNKQTNKTDISGVSATKLPKDTKGWEGYLAIKDGRTYRALFIRRGETQLQITNSSDAKDIEPKETGFAAKGVEYQLVA
ncbi:SH3 domain-containing protein [Fortiea contorta]|uniref:SH3 domain-containing protein n=1 Tax=Fortiea contorta TaxID=1892405 RepID=UPI0003467130|nr:SH3 domain-containing protein [Fortiea contorta]